MDEEIVVILQSSSPLFAREKASCECKRVVFRALISDTILCSACSDLEAAPCRVGRRPSIGGGPVPLTFTEHALFLAYNSVVVSTLNNPLGRDAQFLKKEVGEIDHTGWRRRQRLQRQ